MDSNHQLPDLEFGALTIGAFCISGWKELNLLPLASNASRLPMTYTQTTMERLGVEPSRPLRTLSLAVRCLPALAHAPKTMFLPFS